MNKVNIASNALISALNTKDALVTQPENIGLSAHLWTIPDTRLHPRTFGAHNAMKVSQCDNFLSCTHTWSIVHSFIIIREILILTLSIFIAL